MFVNYKFVLTVRYEYWEIHMVSLEHSVFDIFITFIEKVQLYLSSEQSCIKLTRGSVDVPVVRREIFFLWINNILESVEKLISEGVLKVIIFARFWLFAFFINTLNYFFKCDVFLFIFQFIIDVTNKNWRLSGCRSCYVYLNSHKG
jgi:hypothetical protein